MKEEYYQILAGALIASMASLAHSLRVGIRGPKLLWRMFEAALVGACVAALLYFRFGWPLYVVGGACVVAGFVADRIVLRLNGITDAAADRIEKEVRDGKKEPEPGTGDIEAQTASETPETDK